MRLLLASLAAAAASTAQSPLTTTFANNNSGAVGGAVYFDLSSPAAVTITGFDLNSASAGGTAGTIDVYTTPGTSVGVETVPAAWTLVATGSVVTAGPGLPSSVALNNPISIAAGTSIGMAWAANGFAHAYTNIVPPVATTYTACPLRLVGGKAGNTPFSGTVTPQRLVNTNIYFTFVGDCASVTSQGSGCVEQYASIYEEMTPTGFDLSGMCLTGTASGGDYTWSVAAGAVNAVGSVSAPISLPLGDDDQIAVGTLGLVVGSNGWVALGLGNSNAFYPTVGTLLGNPATAFYAWTDLEPDAPGSGPVRYEQSGTVAQVTFDGVFGWGTSDPNTVQFRIDTATGNVSICWGAVASTNSENWLVGYSLGGLNVDPGPTDLSSGGPFATATTDLQPLTLTAIGRPLQGPASTAFQVTTGNVPGSVVSHLGIIGLSRPGLPLDGLGLPGCFLNASLDVLDLVFAPPVTSPTYTWTAVTLPAGPPYFGGFEFNVQAVAFGTSANSFFGIGAVTSNGLKCVVGDL